MEMIRIVLLVVQDYKIVEKKSTRIILKTIRECKQIHETWSILSRDAQEEIEDILNEEIHKKLNKCFQFYNRKYGSEIEAGYGEMKDIEINLSNICEAIKSWETEE